MNNKANPDDRRDNVEKIQANIDNTIRKHRETEEAIQLTEDEKQRLELKQKNKRREHALKGMKREIRQEAIDRENNYK